MKYASEDLMNEHEGILFGLKILEKMIISLKSDLEIDIGDILEMINFLKLFADKCHHGKEEGLMFPAMEKVGIPNEGGPIGQMLVEHIEGRKYISQMSESASGDLFDKQSFINYGSKYISLMRSHIEKENMVLFPLANKKIPIDIQKQLLELFDKHEEEVMGAGIHEKLHELLDIFEKKYL